jgi:uncharacterized protein (TIGR02145 family)
VLAGAGKLTSPTLFSTHKYYTHLSITPIVGIFEGCFFTQSFRREPQRKTTKTPKENLMSTSNTIGETGTFTDPADGQVYHWKVMKNGKKWMTQNFNRKTPTSVCYNHDESYAAKYGRFYHINEAIQIAPTGWKVPKMEDWQSLENGETHWKDLVKGQGSGFNLTGGGVYDKSTDTFDEMNEFSFFVTTSPAGSDEYGRRKKQWLAGFDIATLRGGRIELTVEGSAAPLDTAMAYCRLVEA